MLIHKRKVVQIPIIYIIGLILSFLFVYHDAASQRIFYKYDTAFTYKINNSDTSRKIAESKNVYLYDKDYNVIEKQNYTMSMRELAWQYNSKSTFSYYKNDVVENYYAIEINYPQLQHKKVYKFNVLTRPLEITKEIRPKTEIILLEKDKFFYEKDTLQKIESYLKGTTFFKNKEIKIKYDKNKITKTETKFSELHGETSKSIKKINFKNNKIVETEMNYNSKENPDVIIKSVYSKDSLLIADTCFLSIVKEKKYLYVVNYLYDSTKHLKREIKTMLDDKGKPDKTKDGQMKVYFYQKNSPILKGSFSDYIID